MIEIEVGKNQPKKTERNRRRTREKQATANIVQTQDGKFIIDSAAAPFLVKPIPTDAKPLTINATVRNDTVTVPYHKHIPAALTVPNGKPLKRFSIHIPELQDNLIAVSDVIKANKHIFFREKGAYAPPKRFFHILKPNDKVAT